MPRLRRQPITGLQTVFILVCIFITVNALLLARRLLEASIFLLEHFMDKPPSAFDQAIRAHDKTLQRHGLTLWVGAEPTFTDRRSEAVEWLGQALGPYKQSRARRMLADYQARSPGGVALRTLGRQYPREERSRWNLGFYQRRDGQPVWRGPPDPLLASEPLALPPGALEEFWEQLAQRLGARGWTALLFAVETNPPLRVAFRQDRQPLLADPAQDPRLARPSLHTQALPLTGGRDELADQGIFLLALGWAEPGPPLEQIAAPCLELPACSEVALFLAVLEAVSEAARAARLPGLILTGYPPPVDPSVAWTTLAPDPAVVEVNLAPAADAAEFLAATRTAFAAAASAELSPYRLHYNGQISDSGGGGHLTLGGPTPDHSPFLTYPGLLPAVISYFNQHPALSYYFAGDFTGNSSQAPRSDERTSDIVEELGLTLDLLARQANPAPELLWQSLSPFLADPTGNPHRSELNIEKLWNPYLPGRGQWGLVEFRPFRMAATAERLAALAVLLRAVAALLILRPRPPRLIHWGRELHDRFALPFYLRADLWEILDELAGAGLGLGQPLIDELLQEDAHLLGVATGPAGCLRIRHGLEFWPLLGEAITQEYGHSRLVDASSARLEISLAAPLGAATAQLEAWQIAVNGYRLPLRREQDADGPIRLGGVRYRRFMPWTGLHPALPAQTPLRLTLSHPDQPEVLQVTWHEWKPQGGGYDGLPADLAAAAARRAERLVVEQMPAAAVPPAREPPAAAITPYCFDLRWCS